MKKSWSWGNYPLSEHEVESLIWRDQSVKSFASSKTVLPYGLGRSYGDVPLNDGGMILKTTRLNKIIDFDSENGILHCESGVSFEHILKLVVPRGWFLPVTPGTQFVTIGGGVANDVHGKNHHVAGTFGVHVLGFELLKSDGQRLWCSEQENGDLFSATIGGLGLTGLIVSVKIQMMKIKSSGMNVTNIPFDHLERGLELFEEHADATYTVAWMDCLAQGNNLGRGLFSKGEHADDFRQRKTKLLKPSVPMFLPSMCLNRWSVKAFNEIIYRNGMRKAGFESVDYEPFFYPLDGIVNWNRIYGKRGFLQYQCVVPFGDAGEGKAAISLMLEKIASSGNASFLAVLKVFGNKKSPGLLSFPIEGITLALDFPNKGKKTFALLEQLDGIVRTQGGRVYPAKDARMSADDFQLYYPSWTEFSKYIDPKFSSSFWRRVTKSN